MGTKVFGFYSLFFIFIDSFRSESISSGVLTQSSYPSIELAFNEFPQIRLVEFNHSIPCDVGTGMKALFDMLNRNPSLEVLITDLCQNVLSAIAETTRFLELPVISFTESDLSLSAKDRRYPFLYNIVPSDHAHNLVRKEILQYFNWTRFGLIYQHGSKYTLIANDFSNLIGLDEKQWEINLTRGIPYRHGPTWHDDNHHYMKGLLKDFKNKDVRIIVASFNQTIARHMFCHAAKEQIYGARYQWIILGFSSLIPWWNEPVDCSMQDFVRAINGTLQTRILPVSFSSIENQTNSRHYFDAYAYDAIQSLTFMKEKPFRTNLKRMIDRLDFQGATGRVRFFRGERLGEILVEQYVACRMMNDGSCRIPCYAEELQCNLTVVKIFLSQHTDSKLISPILYPLNSMMWHGQGPPRDRTNQTIVFQHISISVFISISITSSIGLSISSALFIFNIHFRSHRYIRMSSPSLNNLILIGCMLAYLSIIVMGMNSSLFSSSFPAHTLMSVICPTRLWLLSLSFTLAFGSMFSKTWRVHAIFTNINLTKKGIHDSRLLIMVTILVGIDVIFLISWQIFDPIHRKFVYQIPYRLPNNPDVEIFPYREECQSQHISIWFVILILYKGLLMLYGSFLSWKTRHVSVPGLNDSRYIGLSVYIVFICCTLGSLVKFIPSEQIQLSYFLSSAFILLCTTGTVMLVFAPKIVEVYRDPHSRKRQPRVTARLKRNLPRLHVSGKQTFDSALIDNQKLRFILSMQEEALNRLIEELNKCSTKENTQVELKDLVGPDDNLEENDSKCLMMASSKISQNRISRTVSLCLSNTFQMTQIYLPQASGTVKTAVTRINSQRRSQSMQSYRNSLDRCDDQTEKLLDEHLSSGDADWNYEGLLTLDEVLLDQMTETDLISSNFLLD